VVEGRVQGVFYRASTAELAESLGLHGTVRNLDDGNVELVVAGDDQAVRKLVAWLWQGPPGAEVRAVSVEEWTGAVADGFRIAP
jgi:acylphosphatase